MEDSYFMSILFFLTIILGFLITLRNIRNDYAMNYELVWGNTACFCLFVFLLKICLFE